MQVKLAVDVSERTARAVSQSGIERVVNMTLRILEDVEHPDRAVNELDWLEAKDTVVQLWRSLQDALYRLHNGLPEQS